MGAEFRWGWNLGRGGVYCGAGPRWVGGVTFECGAGPRQVDVQAWGGASA